MNKLVIELSGNTYSKIKYPAGELQVRLNADTIEQLRQANDVVVLARISDMQQIIELCLLCDAVDGVLSSAAKRRLVLPYLPFARADRRFVPGDCFGLATFARIINSIGWPITTLDAHSARSHGELKQLADVSSQPLMARAVKDLADSERAQEVIVLFPDEGARKRYQLPETLSGIRVHVLHCSKKRNGETGKLLGFNVPSADEFARAGGSDLPVIIADDICDGGGTFIGIADALAPLQLSLALYVTHGIFSKGMESLEKRFGVIYTSDSFKERASEHKLKVLECLPLLLDVAREQALSAATASAG